VYLPLHLLLSVTWHSKTVKGIFLLWWTENVERCANAEWQLHSSGGDTEISTDF